MRTVLNLRYCLQKWGDYAAYGDAVVPTKFLPMKTPLGSEILENWNLEEPPRHPLSISILQQQIHDKRIGMIIDLSNHDSLYGADLRETGIQYERVPVSFSTKCLEMSEQKLCLPCKASITVN